MNSLQTNFSNYRPPGMVPNPQLDLFGTKSEEQQGVVAEHLWQLQESILARSSRLKSMQHAATRADCTRSLAQLAPVVMAYSWPWPGYHFLAGTEPVQSPLTSATLASLEDFGNRIGDSIASALSRPCAVLADGHSIRIEFLACMAWVMSAEHRAVFLEVLDSTGEWKMSQVSFDVDDPFQDTLWLDQVLLPWVPEIEQAFGFRAVEAHWQLRQKLEHRFHRPEFISAISRQIRHHLKSIPVLDRVCKHIRRWQGGFALDNDIFSKLWAEEAVWINLTHYYPHLTSLYYLARKEGLIEAGSGLAGFRAMCRQLGMSRAGWRFLSRFGTGAFKGLTYFICERGLSTAELLAYADWQAQAGIARPLPQAMGELVFIADCIHLNNSGQLSVQIDPRFARASIAHLGEKHEDHADQWCDNQHWCEILTWLHREQPTFDRNQWRAGWPAIRNSYLKWLQQDSENLSWSPMLEPFVFNKWRVRPLTSTSELIEEGMRMDHCVGTYSRACYEDTCRIFTVECSATNEPVVTVSLKMTNDIWASEQIRGKRNADPGPEALAVADLIVERMNACFAGKRYL